jgi:hypothetical protein
MAGSVAFLTKEPDSQLAHYRRSITRPSILQKEQVESSVIAQDKIGIKEPTPGVSIAL